MNYKRKNTPYTNINRDRNRKRLGLTGFFMCLKLLLLHPRTHFVICTYGIGDAILACGLLREFKQAHHIRHITLVGKERMRYLYEQYADQYDNLLVRKEEDIVRMTDAFLFDPACYLFMRWLKRFTPVPVLFYYRNLLVNHIPAVNMVNTFKAVIFGLPQSTALAVAKPSYVSVDEYIERYHLVQGKTVILSPAARNTPPLPDSVWEAIAAKLHEAGFALIVNHFDYGRDLPHAVSLDCDLSVMLALARFGGHVISLRSGFCDYMSLSPCCLTVIYPEGWDFVHNVSMAEWGIRDNISELLYAKDNESEFVGRVLENHLGGCMAGNRPAVRTMGNAGGFKEEKAGFFRDLGRMALALPGSVRMGLLLRIHPNTHFVLAGDHEEDVRTVLQLGRRFSQEHDIDHTTMILPRSLKHLLPEAPDCCDKAIPVSGFTYLCLKNAFRFDYAYFHFYEWGRRVTVTDAEVFFRLRYPAFMQLVDRQDMYETALMPVRRM